MAIAAARKLVPRSHLNIQVVHSRYFGAMVREKPAPTLKSRELLTAKGRLDLALDGHPGLRFGSFWIFRNDGVALEMLAEEERLERKKEMLDLLSLLPSSEEKKVKPVMEQTFNRQ